MLNTAVHAARLAGKIILNNCHKDFLLYNLYYYNFYKKKIFLHIYLKDFHNYFLNNFFFYLN